MRHYEFALVSSLELEHDAGAYRAIISRRVVSSQRSDIVIYFYDIVAVTLLCRFIMSKIAPRHVSSA